MRHFIVSLARWAGHLLGWLAVLLGCGDARALLSDGDWARFILLTDKTTSRETVPVKEVTVLAGPQEKGMRWWQILAAKPDGSTFAVRALSDQAPMTGVSGDVGRIERYLFKDEDRAWLEYRDQITGTALLPKFDFRGELLPHPTHGTDFEGPWVTTGGLLGHPIQLVESGTGRPFPEAAGSRVLSLDPGLLVGTWVTYRDTNDKRLPEGRDYDYRPYRREEYDEMEQAGFSFFVVDGAERESWVCERPVFYSYPGFIWPMEFPVKYDKVPPVRNFPETLYRSNFHGCTLWADEPASVTSFAPCRRPADAANLIRQYVHHLYWDRGGSSIHEMPNELEREGVSPGSWDLLERDIPSWDVQQETAYYQLQTAFGGILVEAPKGFEVYNQTLQSMLGPGARVSDPEMFVLNYGFMRGAARCFNKTWGTSWYGDTRYKEGAPGQLALLTMTVAYDMGARYLWFWSLAEDSHVCYYEQLALARAIRAHQKDHPRSAPEAVAKARASVAIALPEGYTFARGEAMWNAEQFGWNERNGSGVRYGDVVGAAIWQAICLARANTPFDFVVEGEPMRHAGYDRIIVVHRDGGVDGDPTPAPPLKFDMEATPAGQPVAPAAASRAEAIKVKSGSIAVDGDLGEWSKAHWQVLPHAQTYVSLDAKAQSAISAEFALAYDDESLYLATRVHDQEHVPPREGDVLWSGDSIDLSFDPYLDKKSSGHAGHDDVGFRIALTRKGVAFDRWGGVQAANHTRSGHVAMVKRDGTTTAYEARVPFKELAPLTPSHLAGMRFLVHEGQGSGRVGLLEWAKGSERDISKEGLLVFEGATGQSAEPFTFLFPKRLVEGPDGRICFGVRAGAREAARATLRVRLTARGSTCESEIRLDLPGGLSDQDVTFKHQLPGGRYLAEIMVERPDAFGSSLRRQIYVLP